MKKVISIEQFADELIERIEQSRDIECCKDEIKNLASMAKQHMGKEEIEVTWKD